MLTQSGAAIAGADKKAPILRVGGGYVAAMLAQINAVNRLHYTCIVLNICIMNKKRLRILKIRYVTSLTRILRTICDAGDQSEEHAEAIRQVEWCLLNCLQESHEKENLPEPRPDAPPPPSSSAKQQTETHSWHLKKLTRRDRNL